jgi:hypothetical protein
VAVTKLADALPMSQPATLVFIALSQCCCRPRLY